MVIIGDRGRVFKRAPVLTIEILESGVTSAAIADVVVVVPLATAAVAASSAAAFGHLGFLVVSQKCIQKQ